MRAELFYNPVLVIERLAEYFKDKRRLKKANKVFNAGLNLSQIASLEYFELIQKEHPEAKVMYDLGANIGTWSLLAKTIVKNAEVFAFEPLKTYQEQFLKNTNGVKGITLCKTAIGSENKILKMNIASHSSSFLEITNVITDMFPGEKKTGEENIGVRRLDDFIKENNYPYPDVMKLDVEGFEIEVLKGASNCLEHCRYLILESSFIERHKGQPLFHDLVHFLNEKKFHVYAFPQKMHLAQPIIVTDVLFKKKNLN